ncbi:MAG: M15 family metallopeptidase [Clostridiales bacterium]|nr:M15 family metallopeptidase [Clostridiales bacterium]
MKKKLSVLLAALLLLAPTLTASSVEQVELNPNRMLYNPWNDMPADYVPADLVSLYATGITVSLASIRMDRQAASFAKAMFDDMVKDGITNYLVVSGYRSYETQQDLHRKKIQQYIASGYGEAEAEAIAKTVVAVPGTSEHQSGYAMDVSNTAQGGTLSGNVEKSEVGRWLRENAWRYGYTLRYPNDKTELTGIIYEPWHFRFVGAPHAQILYERGLCLEEYITLLKEEGRSILFTDGEGVTYEISYAETLPEADPLAGGVTAVAVAGEGSGYIVTRSHYNRLNTPLRWLSAGCAERCA